jgi:hypothetical protein
MVRRTGVCISAILLVASFAVHPAFALSCSERTDLCVANCVSPGDAQSACQARCSRGLSFCLSTGCWHARNRQTVCGLARN